MCDQHSKIPSPSRGLHILPRYEIVAFAVGFVLSQGEQFIFFQTISPLPRPFGFITFFMRDTIPLSHNAFLTSRLSISPISVFAPLLSFFATLSLMRPRGHPKLLARSPSLWPPSRPPPRPPSLSATELEDERLFCKESRRGIILGALSWKGV